MLRRTIWLVVLLTALWGGVAWLLPADHTPATSSALGVCAADGRTQTDDSDAAWNAPARTGASLSQPASKLRQFHTAPANADPRALVERARLRASTSGKQSDACSHLRHVPLLI